MKRESRPIDDFALAAFITGKVPGHVRAQIIEWLKDDDDARELLKMAYEAFATAKEPDEAMRWISKNWKPAA